MTIITDARSGDHEEEEEGKEEESDNSEERGSAPTKVTVSGVGSVELARKTYSLLRWLWSVENRIFRFSGTQDPPDDAGSDLACKEELGKLHGGGASKGEGRPAHGATDGGVTTDPDDSDGDPAETTSLLKRAVISISQNQTEERELKRVKKEEASMVGRMNREERELFVYLSATDWSDTAPAASAFLTELLSSKDPILALNRVRAPIDRDNWRFVPCKKCLATFFADGMGARNFFDTPSGFCLMAFHPRHKYRESSTADAILALRSAFGKKTLDDETLKDFAKAELYVPSCLEELEQQLIHAIKFLSLLFERSDLAAAGYRAMLEFVDRNFVLLSDIGASDPLLFAKLAYFADQVFQLFVSDFVAIIARLDSPVLVMNEAERELRGTMRKEVEGVLRPMTRGIIPSLRLPARLISVPSPDPGGTHTPLKKHDQLEYSGQQVKSETKVKVEPWWSRNPDQVEAWCLPVHMKFGEAFNPRDPKTMEHSQNWPKAPHHQNGKMRFLCQKYQVLGRCVPGCFMAHVIPSDIPQSDKDIITGKTTKAYK
jgi:hypothetical protein